jgi:hypothetical protein
MTAKEAKEKTLYFWRYIAAHPEIKSKADLPMGLWEEIEKYEGCCPLCAYTRDIREDFSRSECSYCILGNCGTGSIYSRWYNAKTNEERQQAANELVAKVEAWEVGE